MLLLLEFQKVSWQSLILLYCLHYQNWLNLSYYTFSNGIICWEMKKKGQLISLIQLLLQSMKRYNERWLSNYSRSNISDTNVGENLTPDCKLDEAHHGRARISPKMLFSWLYFYCLVNKCNYFNALTPPQSISNVLACFHVFFFH